MPLYYFVILVITFTRDRLSITLHAAAEMSTLLKYISVFVGNQVPKYMCVYTLKFICI